MDCGKSQSMQPKQRRVCAKCLKHKPLNEFAPHQVKGRYCRACYLAYFRIYNAARYTSPKARALEQLRGREKYQRDILPQRKARKWALLIMHGGKCTQCGYARSAAALDFDHIGRVRTCSGQPNPEKRRTVSHLLAMNTPGSFALAIEEAKRCRILCSNCHRELTFPGHEMATLNLQTQTAK